MIRQTLLSICFHFQTLNLIHILDVNRYEFYSFPTTCHYHQGYAAISWRQILEGYVYLTRIIPSIAVERTKISVLIGGSEGNFFNRRDFEQTWALLYRISAIFVCIVVMKWLSRHHGEESSKIILPHLADCMGKNKSMKTMSGSTHQ